ncbi:MAG TPA: flagellar motor switch protein FliN [Bdellovibrionota bacterium]|nr:flagellar motor switch protein FliN [Bdellovibrionota bacterium]
MSEQAASPLGDINMGDIGAALAAAGTQNAAMEPPAPVPGGGQGTGAAAPKAGATPIQSLDFILDIPLKLTVELGRSKMAIREILQLAQGSVIELSKFAGEPLEVLVNEKLIARGEVVVVNEKFGIRLTDIISPVERIEQLK